MVTDDNPLAWPPTGWYAEPWTFPYENCPCRLPSMTADTPDTTADSGGSEGWTTTEVAAAALSCTPRTIRRYVEDGKLLGRKVKRGRARPLEIDIASLKRLRNELELTDEADIPTGGYDVADRQEGVSVALLEIVEALGQARERAARAEERTQLTARAESTLREQLGQARADADRLRAREREDRERIRELENKLYLEQAKSWWRRVFG